MLCYDILEMMWKNITYKRNYIRYIQELNNKFNDITIKMHNIMKGILFIIIFFI